MYFKRVSLISIFLASSLILSCSTIKPALKNNIYGSHFICGQYILTEGPCANLEQLDVSISTNDPSLGPLTQYIYTSISERISTNKEAVFEKEITYRVRYTPSRTSINEALDKHLVLKLELRKNQQYPDMVIITIISIYKERSFVNTALCSLKQDDCQSEFEKLIDRYLSV